MEFIRHNGVRFTVIVSLQHYKHTTAYVIPAFLEHHSLADSIGPRTVSRDFMHVTTPALYGIIPRSDREEHKTLTVHETILQSALMKEHNTVFVYSTISPSACMREYRIRSFYSIIPRGSTTVRQTDLHIFLHHAAYPTFVFYVNHRRA